MPMHTILTPRGLRRAALVLALPLAACDDGNARPDDRGAAPAPSGPSIATYTPEIVGRYPHDADAYTQGLVFHDGGLYEGTGLEGHSSVRRVDLETGQVLVKRDLPRRHFGEGIAIVGDRLYQLTWRSGEAFVYTVPALEPIGSFRYYGEGWGLTTDGSMLIMSNGSHRLQFIDPSDFSVTRTVDVRSAGSRVSQLNELEWVNGEIWANVYTTDRIARINPATGDVVGWIDLTGILPRTERTGREDVLNGIAYDAEGDRIFVTGKRWPRLFEIRLTPRNPPADSGRASARS